MITSLQNKRVKTVVRLHKRKYRDQQRKMIVEGYRAIMCAVENKYPLDELYFCPPLFLGHNERSLMRRAENSGARVIEVAEEPFRKMVCGGRRQNHETDHAYVSR